MKDYMKIEVKPHEDKRLHNKGMKNLRQLIIKHKIGLEIEFVGGRIVN